MNQLKTPALPLPSYEADFYAWSLDQAQRLRRARPDSIDWQNVAEEVESLGRSDRRALGIDLKIVLEHLIKWRFQPEKRASSWSASIEEHRDRIGRILEDSPSLAEVPAVILPTEYGRARRKALRDTGLLSSLVPEACPFTAAEVLDPAFWPGGPGW